MQSAERSRRKLLEIKAKKNFLRGEVTSEVVCYQPWQIFMQSTSWMSVPAPPSAP